MNELKEWRELWIIDAVIGNEREPEDRLMQEICKVMVEDD